MLAKETNEPFSDNEWIYEIKWDGYRAVAELDNNAVKLYSRNGNSFAAAYPVVFDALQQLNLKAVLDGELVVMDDEGKPSFQKLQYYGQNDSYPLHYYVFDLLELNGEPLYELPLLERKKRLYEILEQGPVIKYSDHVIGQGEAFFEAARDKDLEGIMAKRSQSAYHPGKRTSDWLKIKNHRSDEAIIAGYTAPRASRKFFGALVLGMYKNDELVYVGHTGSGFDDETLKSIYDQLQPLVIDSSPFAERVKTNMPVTWVEPKLVCELKFSEWTKDSKMRHPIFLRLREDKMPEEVSFHKNETTAMKKEVANKNTTKATGAKAKTATKKTAAKSTAAKKAAVKKSTAKKTAAKKSASNKNKTAHTTSAGSSNQPKQSSKQNEKEKIITIGRTKVKTTNLQKIFFKQDQITKGNVIDYYDSIADIILPYLKDRPESLYRTPNGIDKPGFFHKDAGDEAPSWARSIKIDSDSAKKQIDYLLCNNKATLLYMANLGCIEINPWHSTTRHLDKPDYLIIDIDPSEKNNFDDVVEAANAVKEVLDKAGATGYCKTSGASGLHVYIPTAHKYTYDQVKDFAYLVCMLVNEMLPGLTTLERSLAKRSKQKIYMDYLQNRRGQTIASVYSLRPKPGATVSTPLKWSEVKKGLHPSAFNIHTIADRVAKEGDLFDGLLTGSINLNECLDKLSQ